MLLFIGWSENNLFLRTQLVAFELHRSIPGWLQDDCLASCEVHLGHCHYNLHFKFELLRAEHFSTRQCRGKREKKKNRISFNGSHFDYHSYRLAFETWHHWEIPPVFDPSKLISSWKTNISSLSNDYFLQGSRAWLQFKNSSTMNFTRILVLKNIKSDTYSYSINIYRSFDSSTFSIFHMVAEHGYN